MGTSGVRADLRDRPGAAACLGAWNLFDDLASGTGAAFLGRRRGPVRNRVYDKLFWGSGTFGVDREGQMNLRGEVVPMSERTALGLDVAKPMFF